MKQYKHVGKMKVYCYRWFLATEDGSFRVMSFTSKPKVKGAKAKRIRNTWPFVNPNSIDGFYGFEYPSLEDEYQKMIEEAFPSKKKS